MKLCSSDNYIKGIYELNKKITSSKGSATTLTKEDAMKEIKSS